MSKQITFMTKRQLQRSNRIAKENKRIYIDEDFVESLPNFRFPVLLEIPIQSGWNRLVLSIADTLTPEGKDVHRLCLDVDIHELNCSLTTELDSHTEANQLNRRIFDMQSSFGYRTNQEMLDCHFGGDVQSMMNAAGREGVAHVK